MIGKQFMPVIMALQKDKVANIRMNVAKSIGVLLPVIIQQSPQNNEAIVSIYLYD